MQYTILTGTGITVSRLCLGTMTFGGQVDEAAGIAIVKRAVDVGVNFIDTADCYEGGKSERIVGNALRGIRRDVIIASKVGSRMEAGGNGTGLSRRRISMMVEDSLSRLQTDYLDIYYLHKPDPVTPLEETLQAMDMLVRAGKVRYIGLSNFAAWQVMKIQGICQQNGWIAPTVTQNVHNLITRGVERELKPCLCDQALSMVVYSPLASGMLTGKHARGTPAAGTRFALNKSHFERFWTEYNFSAVEKLAIIAKQGGMTLPEMAMRWCWSQPGSDCVITGVSRMEQLETNLDWGDSSPLPEDVLVACDQVWAELDDKSFQYNR